MYSNSTKTSFVIFFAVIYRCTTHTHTWRRTHASSCMFFVVAVITAVAVIVKALSKNNYAFWHMCICAWICMKLRACAYIFVYLHMYVCMCKRTYTTLSSGILHFSYFRVPVVVVVQFVVVGNGHIYLAGGPLCTVLCIAYFLGLCLTPFLPPHCVRAFVCVYACLRACPSSSLTVRCCRPFASSFVCVLTATD